MRLRTIFLFLLLSISALIFCENDTVVQESFTRIYENGGWGRNAAGEGISGNGSVIANAQPYVDLLKKFIVEHNVKSVVDVGCGDWELHKYISWEGIRYYGYDVVSSVIERDIQKYGTSKIQFICGDGITGNLPNADLLICKDVLMHLPNSYIHTFLSKIRKFKYCLVTNDIALPAAAALPINNDISIGKWRLLDLTKPPFGIKAQTLLVYPSANTVKHVILIQPKAKVRKQ
jgi:SAM-dependent methyltransferase